MSLSLSPYRRIHSQSELFQWVWLKELTVILVFNSRKRVSEVFMFGERLEEELLAAMGGKDPKRILRGT